MAVHKTSFRYGDQEITLETGEIARQADGAVMVSMGDTVVLVTAVVYREAKPGMHFFPLTVNYQEKTFAAGKIPGGFFKREGRPNENETLVSRLIDRPIRPLFPKGFRNEAQVIATVISSDSEINADIPSMIGASAALALSGAPFAGPIGGARVGYIDGDYVLNPTRSQLEDSKLDLIVAGTDQAVLMVESEADVLPEDVMLGAVTFGHEQMQTAINAINELTQAVGVERWEAQANDLDEAVVNEVRGMVEADLQQAYAINEKQDRRAAIASVKDALVERAGDDEDRAADFKQAFSKVERDLVRNTVLEGKPRIDGRARDEVRDIACRVGFLPRAHGSALFTRGETQAMVATTLGTSRDAQILDYLEGESKDEFMLHYNFPPYSVGEARFMTGPKRREIGHGRLAKRAMLAVMPKNEDFPYVLRVVSEVTESNGSSSMATVCGTSMSLMDAGVPIKAPVAGIAMGLIKSGDNYAVLSDILGDEDHLGDMDFKVAGTREGITALQMDIKIEGITREIMQNALEQARAGRTHILGEMDNAITSPRDDLSDYAPRLLTMKVHPDKIREVIGKGGSTIRSITEETGTQIDIDDDGTITIASVDKAAADAAKHRIEQITADVEPGQTYRGKVVNIMDFGAFVQILPGKDGLVHISQISEERVNSVTDELSEGQKVNVKVLEVDKQGRIRLSMKGVEQEEA